MLLTVAVLIASIYPASRLGSEFMPPLNEGDLLYMPTTLPGISITKAKELLQQTDKIGAAAEKQTMAKGRQSGVTQQDIEPHGEYNPNHDLNSQ